MSKRTAAAARDSFAVVRKAIEGNIGDFLVGPAVKPVFENSIDRRSELERRTMTIFRRETGIDLPIGCCITPTIEAVSTSLCAG